MAVEAQVAVAPVQLPLGPGSGVVQTGDGEPGPLLLGHGVDRAVVAVGGVGQAALHDGEVSIGYLALDEHLMAGVSGDADGAPGADGVDSVLRQR